MQKGPGNHVLGLFVGIKHCIWLKIQNRYLEILHKFLQMVWKWVIIQIGKNCCLMWKGSSHRFKISVLISLNKFWNHSTSSVHVSNWEFCLRPWCIFLYFAFCSIHLSIFKERLNFSFSSDAWQYQFSLGKKLSAYKHVFSLGTMEKFLSSWKGSA